jgi:hypothetical protein
MAEPVMPDPRRVVTQGVNLLHRLGVSDKDALDTIALVAETAGNKLKTEGNPKVGWLRLVWQEADRRRRPFEQARKAREGNQHGR